MVLVLATVVDDVTGIVPFLSLTGIGQLSTLDGSVRWARSRVLPLCIEANTERGQCC